MSRNYADYLSGQPVYSDWHQPYQFHTAQQPDYQQPPTHHQYVAARSWQQDRASFYQLDRYPPQLDPDPPDSLDWWQPYQPYNQSTPAARQPNAYQPQAQTLITPFGQQNSLGMDPFVHQRNPDAGYHHGQPEYQPLRTPSHCSDFYGQHQPHHTGNHPWQPSYHLAGQPLQFDQSLSHHIAPLPAAVPPQSGSTHLPLQARKLTDSGQQRGLPNIPSPKVRSLSPVQLAAVNDYNEKLRVYRLDQAALLARVTAWFEESIDDKNIAEENIDKMVTMVLSEDIPEDINDVPNNATHNDSANLDVPHTEFLEEIVKNDEESAQVLVEAMTGENMVYNDKIGDIIDPTNRELEIKADIKKGFCVENMMVNCVTCHENLTQILVKGQSNRQIGATYIYSKSSRSHNFTCLIESWWHSGKQGLTHAQQQSCTFDPGGTPRVSWFPP